MIASTGEVEGRRAGEILVIPSHVLRMAHDRQFKVTVRIGRAGLTDTFIEELESQLKSRKIVKIKMNRGLADSQSERNTIFHEISERVGATLVDARGSVAIYWKS